MITRFEVTPAKVDPGDTVMLRWEAQGDHATICPTTADYQTFTQSDCWDAPTSGTTTFTVPEDIAPPEGAIHFTLTVRTDDTEAGQAEASTEVALAIACSFDWFFGDVYNIRECPQAPRRYTAAAQDFERGYMIWVLELGTYYILEDEPVPADSTRMVLETIEDPLTIRHDTSGEVQPPPGLVAPESGFGLVWRGDVAQSPGYREALGWALAPEIGYEMLYQCTYGHVSGGRFWQACYLQTPSGAVVLLHPLGGWVELGAQ